VLTSHEPDHSDPPEYEPDALADEQTELDSFPTGGMDRHERAQYRAFCLQRLANLLSRRGQIVGETARERALQHTLLDRALYTAYRDCAAAGAKAPADRLLDAAAEKS
jgi:hypothetical protein